MPTVSIIVPARNEEANLATCMESLLVQDSVDFEIIVVDDHSTDRTREIADSFSIANPGKLQLIEAGPLRDGWTGKNNAVVTGARAAHGEWLLFTDVDTVHLPGSLARALKEAQDSNADMLSYSPEQIAVTFWEMAVLPVVFAELARQYPPSRVSDPNSLAAAANGQYILVQREAYDAIGGHAAIADSILEDVALAHAMKASGHKIRFRYAADAVRTRMYRNFRQLRDGWTKNLALLFPKPILLATWILLAWAFSVLTFVLGVGGLVAGYWRTAYYILPSVILYQSVARAHFRARMNLLAILFGMPMFAYLLLRSKRAHQKGKVDWKGRTYSDKGDLLAPSL